MVEQISSLKTGVKYKDTPIGKIPVDWEVVRLENISLKFYNGGTPDTTNKDYWNGKIPWVTGADFENQKVSRIRRYISDEGVKNSATNIVQKGNILVVTRTGVGKLAIAPVDIAISQDITGVVLYQEKALPTYIYWYLNHNENRLKAIVQGTSINGLLRDDLESFAVSLPPLSEQKEIAEILAEVNEAIEKTARIIVKTKELKRGLMQKLFAEGVGHAGFKDTKIGTIPKEWRVVQLSDILDGNKSKYGIYKEKRLYGAGIQRLKIGDVFQKDYYLGEEAKRVTLLEKELISNEVFEKDILIAVASVKQDGIGKVMYVSKLNERTAFDHNVANIRTDNNKCDQKFLFFILKSRIVRKQIERLFTTVGTTFLKASEIDKLLIPLPPFDEQHNIAEIFFEIDTNIEKESNHLEQLKLLKKGLMQVLLTGKLRVTV
ncbi:restriction endonuclease subunit S [bacterium]|nr:restriction endonuclease subunit S [bacterium]